VRKNAHAPAKSPSSPQFGSKGADAGEREGNGYLQRRRVVPRSPELT